MSRLISRAWPLCLPACRPCCALYPLVLWFQMETKTQTEGHLGRAFPQLEKPQPVPPDPVPNRSHGRGWMESLSRLEDVLPEKELDGCSCLVLKGNQGEHHLLGLPVLKRHRQMDIRRSLCIGPVGAIEVYSWALKNQLHGPYLFLSPSQKGLGMFCFFQTPHLRSRGPCYLFPTFKVWRLKRP